MELTQAEAAAAVAATTAADVSAPQRAAHVANMRLRQSLHMDFLMASDVGGVFVVGWVDDSQSSLTAIRVEILGWTANLLPDDLARVRRPDVEVALGSGRSHPYGFWAVAFSDIVLENGASCKVSVTLTNGAMYTSVLPLRCCTETQLRTTVSNFVASGQPGHGTAPANEDNLQRLFHEQRNRFVTIAAPKQPLELAVPSHNVEFLGISDGGGIMLTGWIDDRTAELDCIRLIGPDWKLCFDGPDLGRACRSDVERELSVGQRYPFGFWTFAAVDQPVRCGKTLSIEIQMRSGASSRGDVIVRRMTDLDLRTTMLSQLATTQFAGNQAAEAMICLEHFVGQQILNFNHKIARQAASNPYVERLRPARANRPPRGSIVVCLYGKPEFLFLQAALFSGKRGIEDYEFVYVCNSPELAERLLREARIAANTYGLDISLVLLPGNAGFGGANNAALAHCRSDRILITNPDVFPRDPDWAARHTALVDGLPSQQTDLFGVPLYYDDGSLMHGGMFFDADTALAAAPGGFRPVRMLRVEHYGKGAPPETAEFVRPRAVPAVTGAFISCRRSWFESLGGFTEDYVFGHYEDADLCLKSLAKGRPAWLHDIKLWHLEGKGSTRVPAHEGGSLVNRWLFTRRWGETLAADLIGPAPSHKLLRADPPAAPPPRPVQTQAAPPPLQLHVLPNGSPNGLPGGSQAGGLPAAAVPVRRPPSAAAAIQAPVKARSQSGLPRKGSS